MPCLTPFLTAQSLAEAARREADRRQRIELSGVEVKVIEGNGGTLAPNGNVSVSNPSAVPIHAVSSSPPTGDAMNSLHRYRDTIKRLDSNIRKDEVRLKNLQERLQTLGRDLLKMGDESKRSRNENARKRAEEQIEELQSRMQVMERDRAEVYDSGKKAGYLPGELEGKGIVP